MSLGAEKLQYEQLSEELKLVQRAVPAQNAAKMLRDYIDAHAHEDQLAGTSDGPNPWLQVAPSNSGCCVVS